MAPYVRATYIEEVEKIEKLLVDNVDSDYWDKIKNWDITDYVESELPCNYMNGLSEERIVQSCINNTVRRVHQAMESFIHNCNTIHSRGGEMIASLCSNA